MIIIEIFEENHRFSEQTPHPASINFVGAATSAVSLQASVGPGHHSAAQDYVHRHLNEEDAKWHKHRYLMPISRH
jgi:hypothetical protein